MWRESFPHLCLTLCTDPWGCLDWPETPDINIGWGTLSPSGSGLKQLNSRSELKRLFQPVT